MQQEDIVRGGTYKAGPKSTPRTVVETSYYWTRTYHGLVYYIGKGGEKIEMEVRDFARWAKERIS